MNKILVICGPTASGKSALAMSVAQQNIGLQPVIVNADAMQMYHDIKIIAASPQSSDFIDIPHALYGNYTADQNYSVAYYAKHASDLIKNLISQGKLPILVGGTGLYINALLYGYSAIPDIEPQLRQAARLKLQNIGNQAFFMELVELDQQAASRLKTGDSQRILRAYEVIKQTGRSIFDYHKLPAIQPLSNYSFKVIMLNPVRELLYKTCNERFHQLIAKGAVAEIKTLLTKKIPREATIFKAVGVTEIISYLNGNISLEQAITLAQIKTRQYAKRQVTWFNHQISHKTQLNYATMVEYDDILKSHLINNILYS